jgi:CheY-like chemotaxis protein
MISLNGLRILFADDEKYLMRPTIDALESRGAIVDLVTDGTSILNYLHEKNTLPSVLILDIMMPGGKEVFTKDDGRSTGIEVYKRIRRNIKTKDLPIVITSAISDKDILSVFESYPKTSIITKPFRFTELYDAIEKII